MDKRSCSAVDEVTCVKRHKSSEVVLVDEQPKNDVAPPPSFFIDLSSSEEEEDKVVDSSSLSDERFRDLGFRDGVKTLILWRDTEDYFFGKSFNSLSRNMFKEVADKFKSIMKEEVAVVKENHEKPEDIAEAKQQLRVVIAEAKERARKTREKGKKVMNPIASRSEKTRKLLSLFSIKT